MTPDLYGRVSIGVTAREAVTLIEDEIAAAQYAIDKEMYKRLEEGRLRAEDALLAFAEKHALYRVLARLHQKVATGVSAANHISEGKHG